MDNMDAVDTLTPIFGDSMDKLPPYVGYGPSGHTLEQDRTEEADDFLCLNVVIPAFGKGKYRLF